MTTTPLPEHTLETDRVMPEQITYNRLQVAESCLEVAYDALRHLLTHMPGSDRDQRFAASAYKTVIAAQYYLSQINAKN